MWVGGAEIARMTTVQGKTQQYGVNTKCLCPQCRASSRDLLEEKSRSRDLLEEKSRSSLFLVGWGPWLQMTGALLKSRFVTASESSGRKKETDLLKVGKLNQKHVIFIIFFISKSHKIFCNTTCKWFSRSIHMVEWLLV